MAPPTPAADYRFCRQGHFPSGSAGTDPARLTPAGFSFSGPNDGPCRRALARPIVDARAARLRPFRRPGPSPMPRPLRFLPRLTGLLAAAILMLAGCQRATEESPAPGGHSPTATARQLIDDLRHDDLVAFWKHGLPPAEHAALVARWASGQAAQVPTDVARRGYRQWMGSLTGPGARPALAQRLQQQARRIDRRYGDQIPVL